MKKYRKGFSLIEIIIAIVVIGVMLFMALPKASKIKGTSEDRSMMMRAIAMTSAKSELIRDAGLSQASTAWNATTTDQEKYELLVPYIQYPPTTLTDYSIIGYSINPGASVTDRVVLFRGSTEIDYTSANL